MNKIIRFYNQNRKEFWITVTVIIFIFAIIQLLNNIAKIQNQKDQQANLNNVNENSYTEQSKSLISGGSVSKNNRTQYGNTIEEFLNNCINGDVDKAYDALSTQCKQELYPTVDRFKNTYWKRNFSTKKTYTFQSWNSAATNTYLIKLYEDSLSTGTAGQGVYIEDYYTIIKEDGKNKLNISNFIKTEEINRNNTQKTIFLDTGKDTDTVYATNNKGIKFDSLLYENIEDDFIVNAGEEKTIEIKFAITFREDLQIDSISFDDIVKDYEQYLTNEQNSDEKIKINIEI